MPTPENAGRTETGENRANLDSAIRSRLGVKLNQGSERVIRTNKHAFSHKSTQLGARHGQPLARGDHATALDSTTIVENPPFAPPPSGPSRTSSSPNPAACARRGYLRGKVGDLSVEAAWRRPAFRQEVRWRRGGFVLEVGENRRDGSRVFDAGDDPKRTAAGFAYRHLDLEHTLQSLVPSHGRAAFGGSMVLLIDVERLSPPCLAGVTSARC